MSADWPVGKETRTRSERQMNAIKDSSASLPRQSLFLPLAPSGAIPAATIPHVLLD